MNSAFFIPADVLPIERAQRVHWRCCAAALVAGDGTHSIDYAQSHARMAERIDLILFPHWSDPKNLRGVRTEARP